MLNKSMKSMALVMAMTLCISMFIGCGGKKAQSNTAEVPTSVSAMAQSDVLPSGEEDVVLKITKHPKDVEVKSGEKAIFVASADGAEKVIWHLLDHSRTEENERDILMSEADKRYENLTVDTSEMGTLIIFQVPKEMDGVDIQAEFVDAKDNSLRTAKAKLIVTNASNDSTTPTPVPQRPFEVTLNGNGGIIQQNTFSIKSGEEFTYLPAASRYGYTFNGWYTDKNGGEKIVVNQTKADINEHKNLWAQWEAVKVTITLEENSGNLDVSNTLIRRFEAKYGPLPIPTRNGYKFDGWYLDGGNGLKITDETQIRKAEDHKLIASWSVSTITVTLNPNGGMPVTPSSLTYWRGSPYGNLPMAVRDGYKFLGWFTDVNSGTKITESTVVEKQYSHTLYAHWEQLPTPTSEPTPQPTPAPLEEMTVYFDANGGTVSKSSKTVFIGGRYEVLPVPVRSGYKFAGWFNSRENGFQITAEDLVGKNSPATLYAHWDSNNIVPDPTATPVEPEEPKQTTVYFDANGGTVSPSQSVMDLGGTYSTLPVPIRDGYEFVGWFDAQEGGSQITESSAFDTRSPTTLYAHWAKLEG